MQVLVNGKAAELPEDATVASLVETLQLPAAGHFRNGILLSGLTGELAAAVLCGDELPDWAAPAAAGRFAPVAA